MFYKMDMEMLKWLTGFIAGGGVVATVQSGSVLTRLASSKFTAGIGNHAVATGEHAAAFGTSLRSLVAPFAVAALLISAAVFVILCFKIIFRKRLQNN